MLEFERQNPNWQEQVKSSYFYTQQDMAEGTQFKVYSRPGIDYVVKIPKDPIWMQGYWLAEEFAEEYAVPFVRVNNLPVTIDRIKTKIPESVVQEKAQDLLQTLAEAFTTRDIDLIQTLVESQARVDQGMMQKGLFVPDPTYNNYGIVRNGDVKRFDFGDARISFTGDKEYSGLVRARAASHYTILFFLQSFERKFGMQLRDGEKVSDFYKELMQLPDPHPRTDSIKSLEASQNGIRWNSEVTLFLAGVGDGEFRKHRTNIGHELDIDFLRGLPSSLLSA